MAQANAPDLSGILSGLLSNPAALQTLTSLLGGMKTQGSAQAAAPVSTPVGAPYANAVPTSPVAQEESPPEAIPTMQTQPLSSPPLGAGNLLPAAYTGGRERGRERGRGGKRDLLLALKPFLTQNRCQTVDSVLRIWELRELLRQYPLR